MITSLYPSYYQKSKVFLYPALGHRKKGVIPPTQTYISWEEYIKPEDRKLILYYEDTINNEFERFAKLFLYAHQMYREEHKRDQSGIYIFDLDSYTQDWDHFLKGRYSRLSGSLKKEILMHYETTSPEYPYVESFLYPQKYMLEYSQLYGVDIQVLQKVGEVTSIYDPVQERLIF
jgi:hypothetical protein